MNIYTECFLIAMLGLVLQVLLKYKSLHEKATKANIKMNLADYLKQDWLMLIASVITIGIFLFMLDDIVNFHVKAINWVKFLFCFVGYTGSDIMLRLFSAANKKLNNIIDAKTTESDAAAGTLNTPTQLSEGK